MDSCPKIKILSATFYLAVLNKRWMKFFNPPTFFWWIHSTFFPSHHLLKFGGHSIYLCKHQPLLYQDRSK